MKSRLSYSLKEMFLIDKCLLGSKGANLELSQWFHLNTYSSVRGPEKAGNTHLRQSFGSQSIQDALILKKIKYYQLALFTFLLFRSLLYLSCSSYPLSDRKSYFSWFPSPLLFSPHFPSMNKIPLLPGPGTCTCKSPLRTISANVGSHDWGCTASRKRDCNRVAFQFANRKVHPKPFGTKL